MSESVDAFRRVKTCSGTGALTSDDLLLPCRFEAYQRGDAKIVIRCTGDDSKPFRQWPWDVQLVGTTDAGQQVTSHAAHVVNSTFRISGQDVPNTELRLIAAGLDIGAPTTAPRVLRYGLTNLRKILGNEPYSYSTPDGHKGYRRRIRLRLGKFDVVIEHRPDAEAVLKELSETKGIALTAEATVALESGDTATLDEAVRRLCHLLTLGQGETVSWIYRDSLDENGNVLTTFCGNSITKPYAAAHTLIPDEDMCAFVEATFDAWDEAEKRWGIRNAILAYTDAKIEVDYLESRALKMAVVIEHLKRVYLERTGREFVLPDALFKAGFKTLRHGVTELLTAVFREQKRATLGRLIPGLQGLNRTSFAEAVRGAATELRLPLDNKERRALVSIRDRIVHAMQFCESEDVGLSMVQQYSLLATFAGRLILAALGYDGPYYDWTTRPPRRVRLERLPASAPDESGEPDLTQ